jgi:hypothetical protein
VVVWVFAGGGESEVRGLLPLLANVCKDHTYERKSPIRRKPGPRPSNEPGYGRTGTSLAAQIEEILSSSLAGKSKCDLILIIDDLDCHDPEKRRELFSKAIANAQGAADTPNFVGFASPEVEAWIIADWNNTVGRDLDFRNSHQQMRHWLSTQKSVPFGNPEAFSHFDPDKNSCRDKLSDAIVESSKHGSARAPYSKAIHTPRLLRQVSPEVVSGNCPLFQELHIRLSQPQ